MRVFAMVLMAGAILVSCRDPQREKELVAQVADLRAEHDSYAAKARALEYELEDARSELAEAQRELESGNNCPACPCVNKVVIRHSGRLQKCLPEATLIIDGDVCMHLGGNHYQCPNW